MTNLAVSLAGLLAADVPIANPDPLGYPLPAWLFQALAYLTLTLHFAAVYFTVGGALLLLTAKVLGGERNARLAHFLGSGLPLGVSYLVTFGIPPAAIRASAVRAVVLHVFGLDRGLLDPGDSGDDHSLCLLLLSSYATQAETAAAVAGRAAGGVFADVCRLHLLE